MAKTKSEHERFWPKVQCSSLSPECCWLWTGKADSDGYGKFGSSSGKMLYAHRWSYEAVKGPIPAGLTIDHLCRTRNCVRPEHMEPVTRGENVLRGIGRSATNARKSHCDSGHEFNHVNTYKARNGERHCRPCGKRWAQEARNRLKQSTTNGDSHATENEEEARLVRGR